MEELLAAIKQLTVAVERGLKVTTDVTPRKKPFAFLSVWRSFPAPIAAVSNVDILLFTVPAGFKLYIKRLGVLVAGGGLDGYPTAANLAAWAINGAAPLEFYLAIASRENRAALISPVSWNIRGDSEPAEYIDEALQNERIVLKAKAYGAAGVIPFLVRMDGLIDQLEGPTEVRGITREYGESIGLHNIDDLADREEELQT
jgi:hypothetical protein